MTDEINEIIRVLQLTTYDEEEWDADNLTVMKKALNAIEGKAQAAHDWLQVATCYFMFICFILALIMDFYLSYVNELSLYHLMHSLL